MIKELYLKKLELEKESLKRKNNNHQKFTVNLSLLEKFLNEYDRIFSNPESIEVLKTIRDYLNIEKEKNQKFELDFEVTMKNLKSICKHEIFLNNTCFICNNFILESERNNPYYQLIYDIETKEEKYEIEELLENIILEILENNEDINEVLLDYLDENNLSKNINTRIYRRHP